MKVRIEKGQTLWDALQQNHFLAERPCGGKGICGKCKVTIKDAGEVLSCQWKTPGEYEVLETTHEEFTSVFVEERLKPKGGIVAAVDVGTTTVAMVMADQNQEVRFRFTNPQRVYGADVLSRIQAANEGHLFVMKEILKKQLLEKLVAGMEKLGAEGQCDVFLAANTTMIHILRGLSCKGLGQAPFTPVTLETGCEHWQCGKNRFVIHYMPGISTFVGADIVSGIYGLSMLDKKNSFFIDLGTNGEMAVFDGTRIFCASTAAGPAFEGSELAMKIHGAGILNNLHEMRQRGIMDEYGLLEEPYFTKGYPVEFQGQTATIMQDDIREIQMAKGAIRAGIEVLLKEAKLQAESIDQVFLAGGMGFYLQPEDAFGVGLLPNEFKNKVQAVGNSALLGTIKTANQYTPKINHVWAKIEEIREQAKEVVLAEHPEFEERYLEAMNL